MKAIIKMIVRIFKRPPDKVIGVNYLSRWHVVVRNRLSNLYLHKFTGSDDDRAVHDHSWWSMSILVKGNIYEIYRKNPSDPESETSRPIPRFIPFFRSARFSHRIVVVDGPAWTLFFTGPVLRDWGFWCKRGWVFWKDFTDETGLTIGAGCGEDDSIRDDDLIPDKDLPVFLRRQAG